MLRQHAAHVAETLAGVVLGDRQGVFRILHVAEPGDKSVLGVARAPAPGGFANCAVDECELDDGTKKLFLSALCDLSPNTPLTVEDGVPPNEDEVQRELQERAAALEAVRARAAALAAWHAAAGHDTDRGLGASPLPPLSLKPSEQPHRHAST